MHRLQALGRHVQDRAGLRKPITEAPAPLAVPRQAALRRPADPQQRLCLFQQTSSYTELFLTYRVFSNEHGSVFVCSLFLSSHQSPGAGRSASPF